MSASNIIAELVGKECKISTGNFGSQYKGLVEQVDEKWVKVVKKPGVNQKVYVISLDLITGIEVI